jgi:hypothetical protein
MGKNQRDEPCRIACRFDHKLCIRMAGAETQSSHLATYIHKQRGAGLCVVLVAFIKAYEAAVLLSLSSSCRAELQYHKPCCIPSPAHYWNCCHLSMQPPSNMTCRSCACNSSTVTTVAPAESPQLSRPRLTRPCEHQLYIWQQNVRATK